MEEFRREQFEDRGLRLHWGTAEPSSRELRDGWLEVEVPAEVLTGKQVS